MAIGRLDCRASRRRFLQGLAATLPMAACATAPYRASDFGIRGRSRVALLPASSYAGDLTDLISRGVRMFDVPVRGRRVLLKPNLVEYAAGSAINTHPLVVAAAAEAFLRAGASEVIVGEGPGHRRDTDYLLTATGLDEYLRDIGVQFVDLNLDPVQPVALRSRFMGLETLWLPATLLRSHLVVSVAKLKTHHWAGITAAMKNLFGVVPGAVYGWPKNILHARGIDRAILDLNATIRPDLSIVDAVVAMEGDGPIMGRPKALGFIAMGTDAVAVDATCARVIGLDPERTPYLAEASRFLGNAAESKIEHLGEAPSRYQTPFELSRALELSGNGR